MKSHCSGTFPHRFYTRGLCGVSSLASYPGIRQTKNFLRFNGLCSVEGNDLRLRVKILQAFRPIPIIQVALGAGLWTTVKTESTEPTTENGR